MGGAVGNPVDQGRVFTVFVPGAPVPQGSKRHVGGGVLVESATSLEAWRTEVALRVNSIMHRTEHRGFTKDEPVALTMTFRIRKPPSVRRALPTVKPDLDKLVRAIFDALTSSGLLVDDAQVVQLWTRKRYAPTARPAGVLIHATRFDGAP